MIFEIKMPGCLIAGQHSSADLGRIAAEFGSRVCVVCGKNPARIMPLIQMMQDAGFVLEIITVKAEPTVSFIQSCADQIRSFSPDVVVAIGGGSVLDTGKAISALVTNVSPVSDYLEVVGLGQPLTQPPIPMIAVPTTAGTGSEVTANAVLCADTQQQKVSLRHPLMVPRVVVLDFMLTLNCPAEVTAYSGMDALTQLIEPFVCNKTNPFTDMICREGIVTASAAIEKAVECPDHLVARQHMSLASMYSGLALSNAALGAVHGIAGAMGGMYSSAPHGALCAALLPSVMAVNIARLRETPDLSAGTLWRYQMIAYILTGNSDAAPEDGVSHIRALLKRLCIPGLAHWGIQSDSWPLIIEKARKASSMKGNPVVLRDDQIREILVNSYL